MKPTNTLGLLLTLICLNLLSISVQAQSTTKHNSHYQKIINDNGRSNADRQKDKSRLPHKLLPFMDIKPGMVVFEQGASGGYTTELLARVVGENGKVFAEGLDSSRFFGGRMPQVIPLERGLIYQIPERAAKVGLKAGGADMVVLMFTYHDLALNSRIDRQSFLTNIKNLLKAGGTLIVGDNAAIEGSGLTYTRKLHRIDPQLIIKEFTQAGFKLDKSSDIYHNDKDDLKAHWRFLPNPRDHHRLLMRFIKP